MIVNLKMFFEAIQFLMTENNEIATQNERTKIGCKK